MPSGNRKRPPSPCSKEERSNKKRPRPQAASAPRPQAPVKIFTTRLDEQNHLALQEDLESYRAARAALLEALGLGSAKERRQARRLAAPSALAGFGCLVGAAPELLSCPFTVFFYGGSHSETPPAHGEPPLALGQRESACAQPGGSRAAHFARLDPEADPYTSLSPLLRPALFGLHRAKALLAGCGGGARAATRAANLLECDTHCKTQAAYTQDFPLKKDKEVAACQLEDDLVSCVDSCSSRAGHKWARDTLKPLTRALRRYDFSSAKVVLTLSIPGAHPLARASFGHLELRDTTRERAPSPGVSAGPAARQLSSIGGLSAKWLNEQFLSSTTLVNARDSSKKPLSERLKLARPAARETCSSVEGVRGGGSAPGRKKNVEKDVALPLYCKWSSQDANNPFLQPRSAPRAKARCQLGNDNASLKWLMLGSQNMSKAAWGEQCNGQDGPVLATHHWELGALFSPGAAPGRGALCATW